MQSPKHYMNTPPKGWPIGTEQVSISTSLDGSRQPAMMVQAPPDGKKHPLLVGLHTWGTDFQKPAHGQVYARWAIQEGWNMIYPNFRGPNRTPEAMGSPLAVQDIVDAVDFMRTKRNVDPSRIYLIGGSGGGHMALLMAGRHPEIWAGVSAWASIFDIAAWYDEDSQSEKPHYYAQQIESALGGVMNDERRKEAQQRSSISCLANAKDVPLDINHGIHDGRTGSVPFRHSLFAFNAIVKPEDRLSIDDIEAYYATQQLPRGWATPEADELYKENSVLFRKVSKNARITIFEGGHHIVALPGLNWLAQQQQGSPAHWNIPNPKPLHKGTLQATE